MSESYNNFIRAPQSSYYFRKSPYYPDYHKESFPDHFSDSMVIVFSTKVRKKDKGGVWRTIHCLETGITTRKTSEEQIFKMFLDKVYRVILFHEPIDWMIDEHGIPLDRKDELQIAEEERILNV